MANLSSHAPHRSTRARRNVLAALVAASSIALMLATAAPAATWYVRPRRRARGRNRLTIGLAPRHPISRRTSRAALKRPITVFLVSDDRRRACSRSQRTPGLRRSPRSFQTRTAAGWRDSPFPIFRQASTGRPILTPGSNRPSTIFSSSDPWFFSGRLETSSPPTRAGSAHDRRRRRAAVGALVRARCSARGSSRRCGLDRHASRGGGVPVGHLDLSEHLAQPLPTQ